jgi:hypothetical protein
MTNKTSINFISLCGLVGTISLTIYFSAPFNFMPLPPPNATATQVFEFGLKYHSIILLDTWLQQFGTILSVIFALGLVDLAGTASTLAGKLTLLASAIITCLSLAEGTFALGALQSGDNGHLEAALTCYELTNTFIHIFLLAPSLFLMLGFALRKSIVLPKIFICSAIILGILFQSLGVIALFNNKFILVVIFVLMLQNLWTIAASIVLFRGKKVIPVN